jgi:hypothetical protein
MSEFDNDDFFTAPAEGAPAQAAMEDDFLGDDKQGAPSGDDVLGDDFATPAPAEFGTAAPDDFSAPAQDDFPTGTDDFGTTATSEFSAPAPAAEPQEELVMEEAAAAPEEEPAEQEMSALEKWAIENRERMTEKDDAAAEKAEKMKAEAKEVIEQFYNERAEGVSGNHERNVGAEAEFCKQRDALFSHGDIWERVVSLIDLKGSNEKKQARVSRMRSLLLHMKNEAK